MSATNLGRKVAVESKLDDSSNDSEATVALPTTWMHGKEVHDAGVDLPTVAMTLKNVTYTVRVPVAHRDIPNFAKSLANLPKKTDTTEFGVLNGVSLSIRPGSSTLVLGSPGSGKSSLLKLIAGKVPTKFLDGDILINGENAGSWRYKLDNIAKYVEQEERHLPLLTVRETLEYAETFQREMSVNEKVLPSKVDDVLRILRLERAADTVVGNEFIRGVSGGEKRRLTVGEMLMGSPRLLCLDEITTGLDSSTALSICTSLRDWVAATNASMVASLLQPIPEIFDLFDQLVLLQDGFVVYAGPRQGVADFLREHAGAVCPKDRDLADFVVEYLTDPNGVLSRQGHLQTDASVLQLGMTPFVKGLSSSTRKPRTPQELADANKSWLGPVAEVAAPSALEKSPIPLTGTSGPPHEFLEKQYASERHTTYFQQLKACCGILGKVHWRNRQNFIGPFVNQSIVQGLIVGSLWWQLGKAAPERKISLLFFLVTQVAFFNMVEIGVAGAFKSVVEKHIENKFFRPSAWVLSSAIVHIPFAFVNLALFFTITYWMAGLSHSAADFFRYLVVALSADICMSALFRSSVFLTPNAIIAQVMAPVIGITCLVFSGYVITYGSVPNWLIWLYYLSPFSWTIRSWSLLEFKSSIYLPAESAFSLGLFEIRTDNVWIGLGVLYNVCFYFAVIIACSLGLKWLRYTRITGTARQTAFEDEPDVVSVPVGKSPTSGKDAMPFTPSSLIWKNVGYSVFLGKDKAEKVLLQNINGSCPPGKLMALMGATGAGKTTLLDTLAGRKATGKVSGQILVDGRELPPQEFRSRVAYIQQQDSHMGLTTVREALEFSAALRLPTTTTAEQRKAMVDEALELLELSSVENTLVGDADYLGLSPSQLKRLTIGIELVTNPSVLLADEPTTGLDSKAAMTVLKVLRNIASTGRSIVCTIHQPSAELFFMFDSLLLLQPGGTQVYCGPIGFRGATVREYFEGIDGVTPMPKRMNPATWMVDVVSSRARKPSETPQTTPASTPLTTDLAVLYSSSAFAESNLDEIDQAILADSSKVQSGNVSPLSVWKQFTLVFARTWLFYWRDTKYNVTRLLVICGMYLFLGLVFQDLSRYNFATVQSTLGVMCLLSGFVSALFTQSVAAAVLKTRAPYYRETACNSYHPVMFPVSVFLAEIPWIAGMLLTATPIAYFLIGFSTEPERFFLFWFTIFMLGLVGSSLGIAVGYLLPNQAVMSIVVGVSQNLFWLFNGVVYQFSHIPLGWQWFYYITPYNHGVYGLATSQMGQSNRIINVAPGVQLPEDELVDSVWGFDFKLRWYQSLMLLAFIFVFLSLALVGGRYVRHVK